MYRMGGPKMLNIDRWEEIEEYTFSEMDKIYRYLRSTKRLILKSPNIQLQMKNQAGKKWTSILQQIDYLFSPEGFKEVLDIKNLVHSLKTLGIGIEETYIDRKQRLGIKDKERSESREEKKAKSYLGEGARINRASNWQWRIQEAITEAVEKGWYPLFGTYTVDPKTLPDGINTRNELWTKTPAWDRFVKKFKTDIAEACGYGRKPSKWPLGSTFMQYWALLEHGASGEHPHVHVIWLAKDIPKEWKRDPNGSNKHNTLVDIKGASSLWLHGIQRKTMGLFIKGSWFTENWKIPRDGENGDPREIGSPAQVAGYIGKYMTKGEYRAWKHRTKCTRNFGIMNLINKLNEERSNSILLAMASRPSTYKLWVQLQSKTTIPLSLLREKSKTVLLSRLHSLKSIRARNYLCKQWTKKPKDFFTNFMKRVKDGLRPWTMMPEQRYNFYTQMLEAVASTAHSNDSCTKRIDKLTHWLKGANEKLKPEKAYTLLKPYKP